MLKSVIHIAATVCATLFPIANAQAQSADRELFRWVGKVNKALEQRAGEDRDAAAGSAQISFRRGADGRPTDIVVRRGHPSTAAAAIGALRMIRKLPPLPKGFAADQQVVLNYLVGQRNNLAYRQSRSRMYASARLANSRLAANVDGTKLAALEAR